jgi:hypothetical protein
MKRMLDIGLLALGFMSLPALAQDVKYNYMPGTNFANFHTYKWGQIAGASHPDQILDVEIKNSVDAALAKKGFTKTEGESPDLYVVYQIAIDQEKQWNAYGMGRARFGGMGSATSSTISNGTLTVDFYDGKAKQQVWRGDASKTLDPSSNQQKNQKNLTKAIDKLLKNFPPPVK